MRMVQFIITILALSASTNAFAGSVEDRAIAPFKAFVAAVNSNNVDVAAAECTANSSATDELAPYHWTGQGCRGFALALQGVIKKSGQTDELMTLGTPVVVDVAVYAAYASIPGHLTFEDKNHKAGSEDGMFAVVTKKIDGKWKVESWSWATTKM